MSKREVELELRAAAGLDEGASAVLADFYERDGQLSRAALWRDPTRARQTLFAAPPDFLVTNLNLGSPIDPRRNAMLWLLGNTIRARRGKFGYSAKQTRLEAKVMGEHFGLGRTVINQAIAQRDRMIALSAAEECARPTMRATQRLQAARALPPPNPLDFVDPVLDIHLVELPPDTWPVTHNDLRRRQSTDYLVETSNAKLRTERAEKL